MDTVTHICLGACVGEVMLGKQLGRRASLAGAFANSVPDFDFIANLWLDTDKELLSHRGITHSFPFLIVATVVLALLFERWFHRRSLHLSNWLWFFGIEILLHILLDAFNNYGTGWFEPFYHQRISFHTVFVADPFFSIWIGVGFLGIVICKTYQSRKKWAIAALVFSNLYLVYCVANKVHIENDFKTALQQKNIHYTDHFTTPSPLNNWLWFTVAGNDSGLYVGYRSVFDTEDTMDLHFFPRNDHLLNGIRERRDVQNLLKFSQGFYTIEQWHDTLVFNDLRFGQMSGWQNPAGRFAFHYYLSLPEQNTLVVQRGRFANWDRQAIRILWRRIKGN